MILFRQLVRSTLVMGILLSTDCRLVLQERVRRWSLRTASFKEEVVSVSSERLPAAITQMKTSSISDHTRFHRCRRRYHLEATGMFFITCKESLIYFREQLVAKAIAVLKNCSRLEMALSKEMKEMIVIHNTATTSQTWVVLMEDLLILRRFWLAKKPEHASW